MSKLKHEPNYRKWKSLAYVIAKIDNVGGKRALMIRIRSIKLKLTPYIKYKIFDKYLCQTHRSVTHYKTKNKKHIS